jgi:hypothetical protein
MKNEQLSPLELVRASVNKHGELHLDREHTLLLLNWLATCEIYQQKTDAAFRELIKEFAPLRTEFGEE